MIVQRDRTIRTATDLLSLRSRSRRRGIERVNIDIGLSAVETNRVQVAINRGLRSCGCEVGAAFVFLGIVWQLALAFVGVVSSPWSSASRAMWFMIVLLSLALVGKIVGLVSAEFSLRRAIDRALRQDHLAAPNGRSPIPLQ